MNVAKIIGVFLVCLCFNVAYPRQEVWAATYFVSPTGSDTNPGTSSSPWQSFSRAWGTVARGDTLTLMDGEYREQLMPQVPPDNGTPVTIKAQNDGKAIINGDTNGDGKGDIVPVNFAFWAPYNGTRIILEGLVVKNSSGSVIYIDGGGNSSHITLRRVSAYNADVDKNVNVIEIFQSNDNLVEDCVAAGSGRKMVLLYKSNNNTVRRCFLHWNRWDGREWCSIGYPYGTNAEIYYGNNNVLENNVGYALTPGYHFGFKSTGGETTPNTTNANIFAGNVGLFSGKKYDGSPIDWNTRPQPNACNYNSNIYEEGNRTGLWIERDGYANGNVIKDNFLYGNAALGFDLSRWESSVSVFTNNSFSNNTIVGNGSDNPCGGFPCVLGGPGVDALKPHLDQFSGTSTNKIGAVYVSGEPASRVITPYTGTGAHIYYRYQDGIQTTQPLWPWSMESRVQTELPIHLNAPSISVTNLVYPLLAQYGAVPANGTPVPTMPTTPSSTPTTHPPTVIPSSPTTRPPSPTPTTNTCPRKNQGDVNCDNAVNLSDFELWRRQFGGESTETSADFTLDGRVTLADFERWRLSYQI